MVEPHSSNFRVITTNVLGVRIFRKFTVNVIVCPLSCLTFYSFNLGYPGGHLLGLGFPLVLFYFKPS